MTIVDGAALYERPNFDAPVVDYLGEGKKISVSKKAVRGAGGLGLFYRVKYSQRTIYITDTDIKLGRSPRDESENEDSSEARRDPGPREEVTSRKTKKAKKRRPRRDEYGDESDALFFTRFIGGTVGTVQFSEIFQGRTLSTQLPVYGFRMTGPGTLIDGPPLDFNFLFSVHAPTYYRTFTSNRTTGFLLFGDIMPMLPLYESKRSYLYYGVGVMGTFTSYKVQIKKSLFDSKEFRMGADFGLGYGLRVGEEALIRFDAKYYWERTRYPGFFLSFQTEY